VCIELAISNCEKSRLNTLGKYYSLRGKILQGLADLPLVHYPTTFPANCLDVDTRNFLMHTTNKVMQADPTLYSCVGDVIQEAIATFDRAYDYFLAVGDDTKVAKALSRIAETYLSHLFGPVALLRIPYQERARLPAFKTSSLVSKGDEEEESNSGSVKTKKKENQKDKEKEKDKKKGGVDTEDSEDDIDDDDEDEEETQDGFISFSNMEDPALYALDIGAEACNILLMLNGYSRCSLRVILKH